VLAAEAVAAGRCYHWALFDDAGAMRSCGTDRPAAWPAADRHEAIIAAERVRATTLLLPPLPTAKLRAAAAYAVEDQLAGPADAQQLAVSAQSADGSVAVTVVDRALISELAGFNALGWTFSRIVAETDLAPVTRDWHWYIDAARPASAFLRRPDGSAFPVGPLPGDDTLPPALALALAQQLPATTRVHVHASLPAARLLRWQSSHGAEFVGAAPWQWTLCSATTFAQATNLRRDDATPAALVSTALPRSLSLAGGIAVATLALQLLATGIEWTALKVEAHRTARGWLDLATAAGVPSDRLTDAAAARAALFDRYAELRHANGRAAASDPLPQFARAAPALALLPGTTLKSAAYANGAWTLEFGLLDAAALGRFDAAMKAAGVPALIAATPSGTRARFQWQR
jgi:general secretion pathway protein L